MKKLDITGHRYGRLVGVSAIVSEDRHTRWSFLCDCGTTTTAQLDAVRRGRIQSCGCLRAETVRRRSLTHGHSIGRTKTPELQAYAHAKSRCTNPSDSKYPIYGGRGITMCARWLNDPAAFFADMGPRPPGHTLERKDSNGNYEPNNCEWATSHRQARTRRDNVIVEYRGLPMILKDYADLIGVSYKALHARIQRGEHFEAAAGVLLAKARYRSQGG